MNRPSHWILALFAVMGPALWVWGFTQDFGVEPQRTPPPVPAPTRITLANPRSPALTPGVEALLAGRVIDGAGQPIDGASIRVLGSRAAADTRSSGAFEVLVPLGDPFRRIEVTAKGFQPVIERCAPTDLEAFVVQLQPTPPWSPAPALPLPGKRPALAGEGYVLDADRKPMAGAIITALETGDSTLSDGVGRFLIPIGAPALTLLAWHPSGKVALFERVAPTQTQGLVSVGSVTVSDGFELRGLVRLPDGSPASGAPLVLRRQGLVRRVAADNEGAFVIGGLVAADYQFEVLPCAGALGIKRDLHVEGSGAVQGELRMVAEVVHRIRLLDEQRAPLAGGYVVAVDADARRGQAQADSEGYAVVRGLSGEGLAVVEVRARDFAARKVADKLVEAGTTTLITAP